MDQTKGAWNACKRSDSWWLAGYVVTQLWTRISMNLSAHKSRRTLPKVNGRSVLWPNHRAACWKSSIKIGRSSSTFCTPSRFSLSQKLSDTEGSYFFFSLPILSPSVQQAFNATAVVRHMRKLQLGTSLEGPSQITPTSPCHGHLLPEEEEEEEDDLGNGEEESCK